MVNQGQLDSWINQFKKQATTWTNHVTGQLDGFDNVCCAIRSAFVRQALLTGEPVSEYLGAYEDGRNKALPSSYKKIYSGTEFVLAIAENSAVAIHRNDAFFVIGSTDVVDSWKHILGINE